MNFVDIITLAALAVALVFAIRALAKGKGGCNCGGCSGDCKGCSEKGGCQKKKTEFDDGIKIKKAKK